MSETAGPKRGWHSLVEHFQLVSVGRESLQCECGYGCFLRSKGDSERRADASGTVGMRIEYIAFRAFSPFADGVISFPRPKENGLAEVHLLTGQNGSGKTRLLCALAAACGNSKDLDSRHSPDKDHKLAVGLNREGKSAIYFRSPKQIMVLQNPADGTKLIDNLDWLHPQDPAVIQKQGIQAERVAAALIIGGLSDWSSDTPIAAQAYRGSARISDSPIVAMKAIAKSDPKKDLSFERADQDDSLICQSMANLKLSAAMELQSGEPREQCRSIKITERFEAALSKVTGRNFSFQVARHPDLHLEVKWGGASMKLAMLPDGLRSIIAWLIACIAKLESQFPDHPEPLDIPLILLLDEPESHLHPAWQRQLIPAAQELFPNAQIFAATHSPFVISSVNSGWIHILRMDDNGVVKADDAIPCSKGDSYLDVVEDVLDLKQWYDPETEQLLVEFRSLKNEVLNGDGSIHALEKKARLIGCRSESLQGMMAREIHQIRALRSEDVGTP